MLGTQLLRLVEPLRGPGRAGRWKLKSDVQGKKSIQSPSRCGGLGAAGYYSRREPDRVFLVSFRRELDVRLNSLNNLKQLQIRGEKICPE